MPGIRAFIAVELTAQVRQRLNKVEQELQARCGESARRAVRWVAVKNIHLTLKFLGDVPAVQLPALTSLLAEESARHPAFELVVSGLGVFPNLRRPRVVWAGSEGGTALSELQKGLDQGTAALGFPREERPFSPHLTLGRVSDHAGEAELAALARALAETKAGELGRVQVDRIHLFRSDLRPEGPIYTSLQHFLLRK